MNTKFIFFYFFFMFSIGTNPLDAQLLPDFVDETLNSSITKPVGITFDNTGNAYIWEQSGLVHIMDTTGTVLNTPFIDIREEVSEFVDHGLLGFALDPQFSTNGYIYLLYVVDPHHLHHFETSDYDPNTTIINEATIGRITRYTADENNDFKTVLPDSRHIVLGKNPNDGFPVVASSHGVGTLTFGTDGSLIVSCGETGSFVSPDAGDHPDSFFEQALSEEIIRPAENVGGYRSQLLNSLGGKVLRINPETGLGYSSNPFYDPENPEGKQSKIWLRGLRNPFRIYLDPETGSHYPEDGNPGVIYIGDVGASHWEELNIATEGGLNFGWPVYEGMKTISAFSERKRLNLDAPNEFYNGDNCQEEYYFFHELIGQPNNIQAPTLTDNCNPANPIPESLFPSYHTRPTLAWLNHNQMTDSVAVVPAFDQFGNAVEYEIETAEAQVEGIHFNGSSSIAGFYYRNENFPEEFRNRYFHADFKGWISIFDFDEDFHLTKIDTFANNIKGIVDLEVSPKDGCIYYVKAIEGPSVHRICFGGDPPPIAIAKADVYFGASPLSVSLDASESYHPKDYPFTIEWQLPDGATSDQTTFTHIFDPTDVSPLGIPVKLTVTDSVGNSATDELIISTNNNPPEVEITSVKDGDFYPLSDFTYLPLQATVSDPEHELSELSFEWQVYLYHNNHNHAGPIIREQESFALIEPVGCTDETYWYRIELRVTDPAGLVSNDIVEIFPDCETPFGESIILDGAALDNVVELTWTNSNEFEIKEYQIQYSLNNTDFITIGSIDATDQGTYSFNHSNPYWGINKYRIKGVKENETYDYSNKINVEFPADQEFSLFPNPTDGILNLTVKTSTGQIDFDLYDATGKLIIRDRYIDDIQDGIELPISIKNIPNGVYYFKIKNGISTYNGSVVKMD